MTFLAYNLASIAEIKEMVTFHELSTFREWGDIWRCSFSISFVSTYPASDLWCHDLLFPSH